MIQKPRGTQDLFLNNSKEWNTVEEKFRKVLNVFNYGEIITPMFESKELFVRGVGDSSDIVSKEMYEFTDRKGREFVLRPEGTAPTVRALIENKLYIPENLPYKAFYIGPIFRYERPQAGRYRQFNQLGVEVFGVDSIGNDVELITLSQSFLNELNINKDIIVEINYLISGDERKAYEIELKKYLASFNDLCADCQTRINKNVLRILDCKIDGAKFNYAPKMFEFASEENKKRLNITYNQLKDLAINAQINFNLVRGLDYYTGLVFEFKNTKIDQAIIAGGSYNNLVEQLGGPSLPASGFAIGIERIMLTLSEQNISVLTDQELDLFIIPLSEAAQVLTNKLLLDARTNNLKVDTNWNIKNLKAGFKAAKRVNAKNIIVIGDNSISNNDYSIKCQETGESVSLKFEEIVKYLKGEKKNEKNT
ncbi:histidine--tRNA ligase [Mesoplasma melaleucae]|uniref:Histidine--tRNA ligase n=1 Tax=Mesoplasma melaleucae TaxID=81459 RepID=A0A2K8NW39_9MOLU|nr:histidine--tRNA ligase [Mesoplasma melaleucae]ATZ18052.1 histidyl-tRNA synthetase [Mesoplasma melaleucae]